MDKISYFLTIFGAATILYIAIESYIKYCIRMKKYKKETSKQKAEIYNKLKIILESDPKLAKKIQKHNPKTYDEIMGY